ncbi:MAG: hypothetical protein ACK42Y_01030 [Candidatus Thermochlorobacter sp.]
MMRKPFLLAALIGLLTLTLGSEEVWAQKRPKKEKQKKTATTERKAKDVESITLDKIDITFRVQTPKVKFNIERMPIDVKTDHARFGDISKETQLRGERTLYSNRIYEKPMQVSPRDIVNRERE